MESMIRDCSDAALSWLARLVACETVSGAASNLDLLRRVDGALRGMGFAIRYTYSPDRQCANLYASLGGDVGGVLLSGHTDVVPVAGQEWSRPPFTLTREGDRVFGRGVCLSLIHIWQPCIQSRISSDSSSNEFFLNIGDSPQ